MPHGWRACAPCDYALVRPRTCGKYLCADALIVRVNPQVDAPPMADVAPRLLRNQLRLALPTLQCVKSRGQMYKNRSGNPQKSGFFRALGWVKFETATVKENGRLQVIPIAEAIGVFLIV
jgi:hypothetical protein